MSQTVVQNQDADLVAILTDSANTPVLSLTASDVTADFRKEGETAFTSKSLPDTAGAVTSGNAETYTLVDSQTLLVAVDGGGALTATFNTADFVDISNATAAEVAAVITTDITGASAADVSGSVVITSATTGTTSSIQVTGGTANPALGFATTLNSGRNIFVEIGSGVYTIEFLSTELDTIGAFTFKVNGATIRQFVEVVNIVAVDTVTTLVTIPTCIINGHVFDLNGKPLQGAAVSARILGFPTISNAAALGDELVSVTTDAAGEFFLEVARLATIDLIIPKANFRRQFVVPNQSSVNLFTGIP